MCRTSVVACRTSVVPCRSVSLCATFIEAYTPLALRAVPRHVAPAAARARIARAVCSAPYTTDGDRAVRTCPARLTRTYAAARQALAVHATAAVDARCPELPELPARRRSGGARGVRCLGCTLGEHAGEPAGFGSHSLTEKPQARGRIAGGRRGSLRVPQPLRAWRCRQSRARAGGCPQPQAFPAAARGAVLPNVRSHRCRSHLGSSRLDGALRWDLAETETRSGLDGASAPPPRDFRAPHLPRSPPRTRARGRARRRWRGTAAAGTA